MNSYVTNNILVNRATDDGLLFVQQQNGDVLARLDKYLIVPLEQVPDIDGFIKSLNREAAKEPTIESLKEPT